MRSFLGLSFFEVSWAKIIFRYEIFPHQSSVCLSNLFFCKLCNIIVGSKKNITGEGYFCLRIFRKTLNAHNSLIRLLDFFLGNFGTLLCLIFLDLKSCFESLKIFRRGSVFLSNFFSSNYALLSAFIFQNSKLKLIMTFNLVPVDNFRGHTWNKRSLVVNILES